jgi:hypothetical protein
MVPDEGYSRNVSCTLNLIHCIYVLIQSLNYTKLFTLDFQNYWKLGDIYCYKLGDSLCQVVTKQGCMTGLNKYRFR